MSRSQRGHVNKEQALKKLGEGREGAIQVARESKINSPEYLAAKRVTNAIDRLAFDLTGDREYYWEPLASS